MNVTEPCPPDMHVESTRALMPDIPIGFCAGYAVGAAAGAAGNVAMSSAQGAPAPGFGTQQSSLSLAVPGISGQSSMPTPGFGSLAVQTPSQVGETVVGRLDVVCSYGTEQHKGKLRLLADCSRCRCPDRWELYILKRSNSWSCILRRPTTCHDVRTQNWHLLGSVYGASLMLIIHAQWRLISVADGPSRVQRMSYHKRYGKTCKLLGKATSDSDYRRVFHPMLINHSHDPCNKPQCFQATNIMFLKSCDPKPPDTSHLIASALPPAGQWRERSERQHCLDVRAPPARHGPARAHSPPPQQQLKRGAWAWGACRTWTCFVTHAGTRGVPSMFLSHRDQKMKDTQSGHQLRASRPNMRSSL